MKWLLFAATVLLAACAGDTPPVKAVVGVTLLNPGHAPVDYAVILVRGTRIDKVGTMTTVPIPAGSEKLAGYGKFVTPVKPGEAIAAGAAASFQIFGQDPRSDPAARPERVLTAGEWAE